MDIWGKFSNEQIKKYLDKNAVEDNIVLEFNNINGFDMDKSNFLEHLYAVYLKRITLDNNIISDELLKFTIKLLSIDYYKPISIGFWGEAAQYNLLTKAQITLIENHLEPKDWAYVQIQIRKKINNSIDIDEQLLNFLLEQKYSWGLFSLIKKLSAEQLLLVKNKITGKKLFNKRDRHMLLEAIKKAETE
jgi:hypothetical protein